MKSFRFPRIAIALMVATFLTILAAIGLATDMARTVQAGFGGPNLPATWWSRLPVTFAMTFVMFWALGAIGYGILVALRRSGAHRLSKVVTWPLPRQ